MSGSPIAVPGSPGSELPAFDDPFAILEACHGRIERMLKTLERLPAHLGRAGVDAEALEALGRVRRYFEEAGSDHHSDEECDLFPAIRAAADAARDAAATEAARATAAAEAPSGLDIRDALDALERQHRDMEAAWAALRDELDGLVGMVGAVGPVGFVGSVGPVASVGSVGDGAPMPADRPARLAARIGRFADLYRGHIDIEERVLYAWAKPRLDAGTRVRLAAAMVARRVHG